MSRKKFTFFKQCLQKYSLREYKKAADFQRLSLFLFPRREYKLLVLYSLVHNKLCKPFRRKGFQCVLLVDVDVIRFHTVYALDEW